MGKRFVFLDALKGFAILLMVMAHIIAWNFSDWHIISTISHSTPTNVMNAGFLWQLIYSFHMPLFFLVSGYLTYKSLSLYGGGDAFIKRSKRLLIPYISTGFFLLLLKGYYGYWFLFSLWQLSVIGIILNIVLTKFNYNNSWWVDIIIISTSWFVLGKMCSINIINDTLQPFCDFSKCYNYSIPFLFGYYMKKHDELEIFLRNKFTLFLSLFIIMFAVKYFSPENESLILCKKIIVKVSPYFLGICGSMLFWGLFRHTNEESKFLRLFSYLGKNTMQIYVLHLFYAIQIISIGDFWLSVNFPTCITTQILYSLFMSIVAIALSLITDKFIKKSHILHSLLFGQ